MENENQEESVFNPQNLEQVSSPAEPKPIPTNIEELRDVLFNRVTMIRPRTPDGAAQWFSPDAHVIAMVSNAVNSTAAAFDKNYWPGLVEVLQKAGGPSMDFEQEVVGAFQIIHDFLLRSTSAECREDMTFMDTLEKSGWNNLSEIGRIGYMAMFSEYFMARFWVACRQLYEMGTPSDTLASRVFADAGELLRMLNNKVDPEKEAKLRLRNAIEFAVRAGLPGRVIDAVTTQALAEAE